MARKGGVLFRAGHTEAGCDLARLAGMEPAAVIVEILNDDGTMARRSDLEKFALKHELKIGTIEDLIRYRIENEHTVERIVESNFPTDHGEFKLYAFEDSTAQELHLALVKGKIDPEKPIPVRVHVQNTLTDSLAGTVGRGWPLRDVMQTIAGEGAGVIVFLRQAETPKDMARLDDASGPCIGLDCRLHGGCAISCRNARSDPFGRFDRYGKIGFHNFTVITDHQRQAQLLTALFGQCQANQSASVPGHEVYVVSSNCLSCHQDIAFIFPVFIVHDHDHFTGLDIVDNFLG
jgi:hypothetical protein